MPTPDAPRLKPNELRSWILRGLRSQPTAELPTRRDLVRLLAQFDLSKEELAGLVQKLLADIEEIRGRRAA